MSNKRIHSIVVRAVMLIRADTMYGPRLTNCWLPAEIWVEALQKMGHIDAALALNVAKFNAAFARSHEYGSAMLRFDGSNDTGIFRVTYQHRHYYNLTQETGQAVYPSPLNRAWKDRVLEMASKVLVIPSTRARPSILLSTSADATMTENDGINDEQPQPNKRPRLESEPQPQELQYWPNSPEARQVFKPITAACNRKRRTAAGGNSVTTSTLINETAQEALERRIKVLQSVHEDEQGWRNVVMGRDSDNYCTKLDIFEIRQRSIILCCAYKIALTNMNRMTWHECCKGACRMLNSLGIKQATYFKTVANWNKAFRKFECFPHPNPYVQCGKRPLPRLLEAYPDAKEQIVSYGLGNLAMLTIESLHDFILSKVFPRLTKTWMREQNDMTAAAGRSSSASDSVAYSNDAVQNAIPTFLHNHGLQSMGLSTTWRWMRLLGFNHDAKKKSFYVDGHERDDVVTNRTEFCKRYLTEYEPYCKRWVQLPLVEATSIRDIDIGFGYTYFDIIADKHMIEFHVDYWNRQITQVSVSRTGDNIDMLLESQLQIYQEKKATTSIRVSSKAKPIMIIGQDESVFAQYLLGSKTWVGPKGQRPLLPKSEGDGYMLSAFVSREFGFGRKLTEAELVRINCERRGVDKTYTDTVAAMEILKTTKKPLLVDSPFVKYLYIGANNEGFWNSFHMSLQFEDIVDCVQVLYPEYEFVFFFDHSQGHARKREGALSAQQMSRHFGGTQPIMRDTIIVDAQGYLGPHLPCLLEVGQTQSFVFKADDCGPWYLSPEQRDLQRHSKATGRSKLVERSKKQLFKALTDAGISFQQNRNHTKKELQDFARIHGVALTVQKELVTQGWEGQPKGLQQVLWERGFISEASLEKYTLDGRKDPISGQIDLQFSLRHLLSECTDFREEETALQYLGRQLGVAVQLTPKFHAELAGEGVEYSWAHAKAYYRRVPVSRKRGRENFKLLVKECTCPETVLTKDRIEKFASRARAYICTYHHLQQQSASTPCSTNTDEPVPIVAKQELLYNEIERLMKAFKGHRCALDFDRGFVNSELKKGKEEMNNNDMAV
jgi:hypothetical protein